MTKLDTSRQFGTIAGVYKELPGAMYTQDGKFFDAQKELINEKALREEGSDLKEQSDSNGHDEGRHGHDDAIGEEGAQAGDEQINDDEGQDEEGNVLEQSDAPVMDKTDDELNELSAAGMTALRNYAAQFGVKGISKSEIINELKALR